MAKTKIEKIASIEEEIKQLENKKKRLIQEQFKTFLEQTIATKHSRRVLDELTAQNAATAPTQGARTAVRGNTPPAAKAAHTAQEGGADGSAAQG